MRTPLRASLGLAVTALVGASLALPPTAASAADDQAAPAPVQDFLADQLGDLGLLERTTVLVHGRTLQDASDAVRTAGLTTVTSFDKIGVVAARGTKRQITAVRAEPGVTYVEGNQPIELSQYTSNTSTRGAEAVQTLTGADGSDLDGSGVSVAVIDSGVDPTHPYLQNDDGSSAVVKSMKVACDPFEILCQVLDTGALNTDALAVGGHGLHVSGIVAGRPTTAGGQQLQGAAPGASIVSLGTGAVLLILGADVALNWVLENHEAPCGEGVPADVCPPIKVTNNSYGPSGGGAFDPNSATVKLQRELAAEGVVTVWANGNDGGDGTESLSNPPGMDPTGGILSVASYNDLETGTRDGAVSSFSSRGQAGAPSTYPDISAPGDTITSSCRIYLPVCTTGLDFVEGGDYNTISGTSMAAPHIAGIVAQLFEAVPGATPAQVEQALKSTAHKYADGAPYEQVGSITSSYDKGAGLVDVVAAVAALRQMTGG